MFIRWFDDLTAGDVAVVGSKNASLGEMIRALKEEGVRVLAAELSDKTSAIGD